ncbi:hypothetical protein BDN72DRAFT_905001 [Pluteus cervinus]|uniref:Uncharacterized protein n=1 Tax=Pluteus cervinus TaxID=181527 RepID=A0ACD3A3Y7_9AGAR|nr:hypothetical protein BDN72DRAFT_905001 [Pluteus cervinus]
MSSRRVVPFVLLPAPRYNTYAVSASSAEPSSVLILLPVSLAQPVPSRHESILEILLNHRDFVGTHTYHVLISALPPLRRHLHAPRSLSIETDVELTKFLRCAGNWYRVMLVKRPEFSFGNINLLEIYLPPTFVSNPPLASCLRALAASQINIRISWAEPSSLVNMANVAYGLGSTLTIIRLKFYTPSTGSRIGEQNWRPWFASDWEPNLVLFRKMRVLFLEIPCSFVPANSVDSVVVLESWTVMNTLSFFDRVYICKYDRPALTYAFTSFTRVQEHGIKAWRRDNFAGGSSASEIVRREDWDVFFNPFINHRPRPTF